jgi:2-methylcitrate dehydratase PrpD
VAACLVVRGSAGYESVDDSALDDPAIAALRHRVHIREDPAMNSAVPALKPARVTLTLKDGQQIMRACDSPRGDCLNPYEESEIRLKFRQLAGFALTPRGLGEVERAVDGFEHWTSATELTDVLRRHGRPDWSRAPSLNS